MKITAVYPGTFDPITNGHSDIVSRAVRMFDRVIVAIADHSDKHPLFSLTTRVNLAKEVLKGDLRVEIFGFSGLLIDFAKKNQAKVILRGLRAVSDFEYEFQMASMNRQLEKNIETIFLTPSEKHIFISASLVKEIAKYRGDVGQFVKPTVLQALHSQFS